MPSWTERIWTFSKYDRGLIVKREIIKDMPTNIVHLISKAKRNGISVFLDEGKVKVTVAKDAVVEEGLIAEIRNHKAEIRQFLDEAAVDDARHRTIEPVCARYREKALPIPLSFGQERLWFVDQLEGSVQYHLHSELRINGRLNVSALESALKSIVDRHEILRTVIEQTQSSIGQRIIESNSWHLNRTTLSGKNRKEQELPTFVATFIHTPFDLATDYMLRACLIELGASEYLLVLVIHHIAADAWSIPIIARELSTIYHACNEGRPHGLPVPELQYADYSIWQRGYLQNGVLEKKLGYWRQRLANIVPLMLPTDYPRTATQLTKGQTVRFDIEKDLTEDLRSLCKAQDVTLFMLLLAAYEVLLQRYSGQENICVGVPVAGRDLQETHGLIGFFINTIIFQNNLDPGLSFSDLLQRIKEDSLQGFEHADVPFDKVVEALNHERDRSRNSIFDAKFALHTMAGSSGMLLDPELTTTMEDFGSVQAQLDLSMDVQVSPQDLRFDLTWREDLFQRETIIRMGLHYKQLLIAIVSDVHAKVCDLSMITPQDRATLASFNKTFADHPADKTIIGVFEEQAGRYPDNIALIFCDQLLTYRELDERASRLGAYLRQKGVNKDVLVPVCKEKSIGLIVGILAVMKAGGAYIPVDPEYPADRISFVVKDCNAKLVLLGSDSSLREKFTGEWCKGIELVLLDDDTLYECPGGELVPVNTPSDLAYCIYTSGTTGQPKGVLIEHRGLVNVALHHLRELQVGPNDRVMQFFASAFDASVLDIFTALSAGAALVMPPQEVIQDAGRFVDYLGDKQVTIFTLTPSYLSLLAKAEMPSVRILITGGEACKVEDALYYSRFKKFYNAYGPSEVTVNATLFKVDPDRQYFQTIPIGRPADNKYIHIIRDCQLCPIGITGEICIGGVGLSRGYLNNNQLTTEKFIPDPYQSGARLYRTGDLGKWLADGTIEYVGRADDQVKIRGYRIEPGEIESLLLQSGLVDQAVVLARGQGQDSLVLTAYVVVKGTAGKDEILEYLSDRLPSYMVPSILYQLDSIPLTTNGKADKQALPDPACNPFLSPAYEAPRTSPEKMLGRIWEELLGNSRIGIHDDFFAIGGHSLLAIKMVSAIRKQLSVDVSIADIFDHLTIKELAAFLEEHAPGTALPPIRKQERPFCIPLSFAQERLWFIDQLEGSVQYHNPIVLRLTGELDRSALDRAFYSIINRHEVLRTIITQHGDETCQTIIKPDRWKLDEINAPSSGEDALRSDIEGYIYQPFDLSKDYMIRAAVIPLPTNEHILIIVLHHIAVDGWSLIIFERELIEAYNSGVHGRDPILPELPVQYADYAIWQRQNLAGEALGRQLDYWENKLRKLAPLALPADRDRQLFSSRQGGEVLLAIDKDQTLHIRRLADQQDATLFMVMLAAFKVLLYRYTGQEDICVCSTIAHRAQHEVAGSIGLFINMLALRDQVRGDMNFPKLLASVRTTTLEAYEHHDAPFEKVAERLFKDHDHAGRDLFQVWFVIQNESEIASRTTDSLSGLQISPVMYRLADAKSDIGVTVVERKETLKVVINYNANLFLADTMEQLVFFYQQLLNDIIADPSGTIGRLANAKAAGEDFAIPGFPPEIDKHSLFNFD